MKRQHSQANSRNGSVRSSRQRTRNCNWPMWHHERRYYVTVDSFVWVGPRTNHYKIVFTFLHTVIKNYISLWLDLTSFSRKMGKSSPTNCFHKLNTEQTHTHTHNTQLILAPHTYSTTNKTNKQKRNGVQ